MIAASVVRPTLAVGAVIFLHDGVVLVRRAKPPLAGHWTLPGGSVELAETLAEATVREVVEETGLAVTVRGLVDVYEHVSRDPEGTVVFHYVILDYLCDQQGGVLSAGSDASGVAAVREGDFDRYGVDEATRRVVARARELTRLNLPPGPLV
jgi:ADP-ribose pyrophosphatase YjhB (NUDIX family)